MNIVLTLALYVFLIFIVTVSVDRGYYKSSERYWYFFKVWYLIHLIPDFMIWYSYFYNGVKLPYDYGFINLIKIAPFWLAAISLFFSDLIALSRYLTGEIYEKRSLW